MFSWSFCRPRVSQTALSLTKKGAQVHPLNCNGDWNPQLVNGDPGILQKKKVPQLGETQGEYPAPSHPSVVLSIGRLEIIKRWSHGSSQRQGYGSQTMTPLEVTGGHLKIQVTQIFSTMKAVVKHTLAAVVKNSADEWKRCKEWTRFRCVIRGVGRIFGAARRAN